MTARRWSGRGAVFLAMVLLLPPLQQATGQGTGTIRGTVRNAEDNTPVAGAQVTIAGQAIGGVTNQDGRYELTGVPAGTHTVRVQFLGFGTEERAGVTVVAGQPAVADFQLRTQVLSMSELVVTGVTEATSRARLPFTVASVTKEAMPVAPRTATSAIQGRVSGATVIQSPQPGEGASIMLRTPTSINRENNPLIVVDGTILTENSIDISSLDIESVEVVKGAAAASLYGSRAAAGVIQIRTVRGSSLAEGSTRFTVRSEYGTNDIPRSIKWARHHPYLMNASGQFLDEDGQVVDRPSADFKEVPFQDGTYPGPLFDHVESLFDPGSSQTHMVTLGHNAGNTSWLATGSYLHTKGVTLELDGYKRADFRVNLDHRLANTLSFSASLFHMRSRQDDAFGGALFDFINIAPDVDLLQPDPDGTKYHFQPDDAGIRPNPLYGFATQTHEDERQRTLASLDLRYNPLAWLAFDVNGSYDRSDRDNIDFVPKGVKTSDYPDGDPGSLTKIADNTNGINASAGISASRDFGLLRSRLSARALVEREDNDGLEAAGEVFSVGGLPDLDALVVPTISSSESSIRSTGYYLNTDLDYADKYIASGLVRRDGSSLFGPEERWHTYYRVSGAYRMAVEPWWPIPQINEFKLRYSRGTAGGRPNFPDRFEVFTVQSGGGLELQTLGNPFLKPEMSTEQEFGVDMVALERLSLQLTYATQKTVDQLVQVPLPRIFGFGSKWENAGTIEGHTYEATLEARIIETPDLRWSTTLVADRSRNRITAYDRPCHTDDFGWRCAGEQLGMFYTEKFLNSASELPAAAAAASDQFQVNDDGLLVWVGPGNSWRDGVSKSLWGTSTTIDGISYGWGMPIRLRNADGQITRVRTGDGNPDVRWGLGNNIQWKGFNLYALVDGQVGGDVYNNTKQRMYQHQRSADEDQAGKPDELKKPITYYTPTLYNAATAVSWFVEDGSYVKLREVSLRYAIDASRFAPLARFGMDRAILSLIGRNLYTWSDYSGYDPEIGGAITRVDDFDFPQYRTLTAAIEIVF